MVRAMRNLILILALLPNFAVAQWAPRPTLFSYDASFMRCSEDPDLDSLVATCTDHLVSAYVLRRAVALAFQQCANTPLRECALPFENAGLPAFGAQIAADVGCETTDITTLKQDQPLSPDHCVSITADILSDEGALPLDTSLDCSARTDACLELASIQRKLWEDALQALENGPLYDPTIRDLQERLQHDCRATVPQDAPASDIMDCISTGTGEIWRDLIHEIQG